MKVYRTQRGEPEQEAWCAVCQNTVDATAELGGKLPVCTDCCIKAIEAMITGSTRSNRLVFNGVEWVDERCGCRYHPDDDNGTHGGAPHVHLCAKHSAVRPGDIVQLDPEHHVHAQGFWAGQLLLVEEVKGWGIQGYAQVQGGRAYYRAKNGTFAKVGRAEWVAVPPEEAEEPEEEQEPGDDEYAHEYVDSGIDGGDE